MISDADLKARVKNEVDKLPVEKRTHENMWPIVVENLAYMGEHLEELAPDAKLSLDKQIKLWQEMAGILIEDYKKKPDSLENRKILRQFRIGEGSHFEIQSLLGSLDKQKDLGSDLEKESNNFFIFIAQIALDFLSDIGAATMKSSDIIFLGLFYSAIDEITIAHHLALHKYAPQSLSHSRIVLDILEKIELFNKIPGEVDLWTSGDEKRISWELSPASVREKLGKSRYDPTYSDLSNKGSHASFEYLRSKVNQNQLTDKKRIQVSINVGGSSNKEDREHAHVACNYVAGLIVHSILLMYQDHLRSEEVRERVMEMHSRKDTYYKNRGMDIKELDDSIDNDSIKKS